MNGKIDRWVAHFRSYSGDDYYMLTYGGGKVCSRNGKKKISARRFCKEYIRAEWAGWARVGGFKYEEFVIYPVRDDGTAVIFHRHRIRIPFCPPFYREKIDTCGMKVDKAVFSDGIDYVE